MNPRRALLLASLLAAAVSCVDGPYPIVNPNDPLMPITLRLTGGVDTVRTRSQVVQFQLTTVPAVTGYQVDWQSSNELWLASTGNGRFVAGTLPPTPRTVLVTAALGNREAFAAVVIMPPP